MKKILIFMLSIFIFTGCSSKNTQKTPEISQNSDIYSKYSDAHIIKMSDNMVTLDSIKVNEYDYSWHIDPSKEDEWFEGDEPNNEDVYIAHDVIYYPTLGESSFVQQQYDDEVEWVSYYTNGELKDYIFSTLPILGNELPTEMMHSEQEAYNNPVIHINKAGSYILEGTWHGQIYIDLGEDAFNDETQKVTIILNGADVTCDVAPAIIFKNVYEVDNAWEENETHTNEVDLTNAGAKVVIVDGTENNFTGANVYRLLKTKYKNEEKKTQKKRYKIDGAFYSFESMLIEAEEKGTGILNITSTTFEGLDTELHLTINSGYINIVSQDDGINVNEDDVSVFTVNDGRITIFAAQGAEGDCVDSNGYIKINGGTLLGTTPSSPDEILDSNNGTEVSENAKVISSGEAKSNLGGMPGGFGGRENMDFENFDPNNMPQDFDFNNMPQNFNPNNMPQRGENPPSKFQ